MNATPVRGVAFGLFSVMVSVLVPLRLMLTGLNTLVMVGGELTVKVAMLLTGPVPAILLVAPLVVLLYIPAGAVTLTSTRQVPPAAAIEPPERLIEVELAAAPVTVPPQLLTRLGAPATTNPPSKESLKARLVSAPALLLVITTLKLDTAPGAIKAGVKDLTRVGCAVNA